MKKIVECEEELKGIHYEYDKKLEKCVCTLHLKNNSNKCVVLKPYNYRKSSFENDPLILKRFESKIIKLTKNQMISLRDDNTNKCLFTYIITEYEVKNIMDANREFLIHKGFNEFEIVLIDSNKNCGRGFIASSKNLPIYPNSENEIKKLEWMKKDLKYKNFFQPKKNSSNLKLNLSTNYNHPSNSIEEMRSIASKDINEFEIPLMYTRQYEKVDNYIYFTDHKLGCGSFGEVYYGKNLESSVEYAIKVQYKGIDDDKIDTIFREVRYLEILDNIEGFPKKVFFGKGSLTDSPYILVESLLGPSLDKLLKFNGKFFSITTISYIGIEMMRRIKDLHNKRIIHRDIKPDNFVWGNFSNRLSDLDLNRIYLIDFGLSFTYCNEYNKHIEYSTGNNFIGTLRYASLNAHLGIKMSRRDDIESILYVLIFLFKGYLPWQGVKAKSKSERMSAIKNIKFNTSIDKLCEGLPYEFNEMLYKTKNLKFTEIPKYDYYIYKFEKIFAQLEGPIYHFEWIKEIINPDNKLKLKELYSGYPLVYHKYIEYVKKEFFFIDFNF